MLGQILTLCSVIIAALALIVTLTRNSHSDLAKQIEGVKEEAKRDTQIKMSLDSIQSDTREIKEDIGSVKKEVADHGRRLAVIEETVKADQHRMDVLEHKTIE